MKTLFSFMTALKPRLIRRLTPILIAGLVLGLLSAGRIAYAQDEGASSQKSSTAAPAPATANPDPYLQKDAEKDRVVSEAQSIVAIVCVTGDCYKDSVTDPCNDIGESCIRPTGKASENGDAGTAGTKK